jgi:hypothetical protein
MATQGRLPKYNGLLNPLFQALHDQIVVNSGPDRFFGASTQTPPSQIRRYLPIIPL